MSAKHFIYPGSFSPPTFGHLEIIRKAAEIFPKILVVCSRNRSKKYWFTEQECANLWTGYSLPDNVSVTTFTEVVESGIDLKETVMVRGLRGETDSEEEKRVMIENWKKFGLNKFFFIITDEAYRHVSSSAARQAAEELDWQTLAKNCSPLAVSALLEKVHGFEHLFLVVGRPGSGKSTFVKSLVESDERNIRIDTDDFNHRLRPELERLFGTSDLATIALHDEESLKAAIAKPWFAMLTEAVKSVPAESRVFVEVPYGLQADKQMFRYLGGKVIYVGCDEKENYERVAARGTIQLQEFVKRIPGWEETLAIAEENRLFLCRIKTDGEISQTIEAAFRFNQVLNSMIGETSWTTSHTWKKDGLLWWQN